MIDSLIKGALNNRLLVMVAALALIVLGFQRFKDMPIDVFPDLSAPTVTIVTEANGMAPEEVERLVTFPLESTLNGATGVRRVRSSTSIGVSVIWVEFEWGRDIYVARQIVTEKIQLVQPILPPGVEPPILAPISSIMGEILFLGLSSDQLSAREVRTIADWEIRRRLLAVSGVAQVIPIGGEVQQFQVLVRAADLVKHRITLREVVAAVRASNQNVSAGFFEQGGEEYLIYGLGRVYKVEDIADAVIEERRGRPLRIGDVADIKLGSAVKRGDAAIDGRAGVLLSVQKQPDANTLALTKRIEAVLDDIEVSLPEGVRLERGLLRQADFIETGVNNVKIALRDGAVLVILIVGLFLFSGRATIITALAIPLSLITSALVLHALGATLNTMTLGGMAIAVGALVDDAIIDVENVVRRLREYMAGGAQDRSLLTVVYKASAEIRGSIVFATLIIILVFLPLFFLEGVESRLLQPLGMAYILSLAASLVVALTLTPVLCFVLLPKSRAVKKGLEPAPVRWLRAGYDRLLPKAMKVWPLLVGCSVLAALISVLVLYRSGRTFLPEFNEGALTISLVTFPGTSLSESNNLGQIAERMLAKHPEVASIARRTGRAELDEHAQGIHYSEFEVRLQMFDRDKASLLAAMRADFQTIPGANLLIGQPISHRIDHMISGTRANIAVKIFGHELVKLRQLAETVRGQMEVLPGVVDLSIEDQATLPLATIRLKRDALAQYGLTVEEVAETLETAFYGTPVSRVFSGSYAFDLVVRYPDHAREDLDVLRQTMVGTSHGVWVPLEALAEIRRDRGPNQISRENGQRKIVVMCNVGEGGVLGEVVEEIQNRIKERVPLPDGYYVEYGGQFESAEKATRTLMWLGAVVIFGIFLLLNMASSSTRDALLIMLNLPLALIGGVVGVMVTGGVVSVASIIGFITLFGIATRNGIMMVTHIRHLVDMEGESNWDKAVRRGASERLIPILMTALASGLGLLPLALASGEPGSEIQAPMAVVILFGLVTSTILNMFIVPIMMHRFGNRSPA